uniref:Small ribosomal subunit protein mS23 n=1 Tax=Neogobius melanostomus TaxID=47308 RepID=A0A8C6U433_9GOBI
MAGSRLEKVGTVFTRVRDLMRAGVMKPHEKPIWFDIYAAFPPKRNPLYVKPHIRTEKNRPKRPERPERPETVPDIFYAEDHIRAKFYKVYAAGPRALDLSKSSFVSTCQRFVEQYEELQKSSDMDEDALFEETGKRLLAKGIILRRQGPSAVAPWNSELVMDLNLKDMLAEQQSIITQDEATSANPPLQTTVV